MNRGMKVPADGKASAGSVAVTMLRRAGQIGMRLKSILASWASDNYLGLSDHSKRLFAGLRRCQHVADSQNLPCDLGSCYFVHDLGRSLPARERTSGKQSA